MAKKEQKSNREVRKPKSVKPKAVAQASPFAQPAGPGSGKPGKRR